MAVVKGLIEVASNAVLDVLVRGVAAPEGPAREGWGANVQLQLATQAVRRGREVLGALD